MSDSAKRFDNGDVAVACILTCFITIIVTGLFLGGIATPDWKWHKSAVEAGVGRYDSKTGAFKWVTE